MTPDLAHSVSDLIDDVLDVVDQIHRRERPDLYQEKQRLRMKLDAFAGPAGAGGTTRPTEGQLIQRALIYWTDEVLTAASGAWQEMTFEFDYFREQNRAWRYYEYGERHARSSSADVIEVWYLCLVLGFQGQIEEGFRDHLNLPLPGRSAGPGQTSAAAREAWATELSRQIRQIRFEDQLGEPLQGDVEPLVGGSWLLTSLGCLFVAGTAFAVLLTIWLKLDRETSGGPATRRAGDQTAPLAER